MECRGEISIKVCKPYTAATTGTAGTAGTA